MKYLKVWTSFREVMDPLSDDEKGRLFEMMLIYAESFTEPADFAGNERFVWPAAKQWIDLTYSENLKQRENGKKGGRPKTKENPDKPNETQINPDEANETLKVKESNVKKSKVKENNTDIRFARFWSVYPRKVAKPDAKKKFEKLNPDDELLEVMIKAVEKQKQSDQWTKDNGQFIPHPSTWIHQRRWEDETPVPDRHIKTVAAQGYEQRDYSDVEDELMRKQNERILKRLQEVG